MIRSILFAGAAAALALSVDPAAAQSRVRVGALECRSGPSVGMVVGSVRDFSCIFRPTSGPRQRYTATIRRIGLDIGVTTSSALLWTVLAPSRRVGRGELAGNYAGAGASGAIGVGVGANALVGGSRNTFALQPVSVEAQTGVNLALGIQGLELRYSR